MYCHPAERAAAESSATFRDYWDLARLKVYARPYFARMLPAWHPAFDVDTEQARASIRKLADLGPAVVWAGHAGPVTGDVAGQLRQAASAPL